MPKPPAAEPENVWKEIIAQAQVAGNGAQDCGARHAGDTVNPDSNDERPAGCRSPVGERGRSTDFTGWPSTEGQTGSQYALEGKTMNEKALLALRQSLRIIRRENDVHRARIEYYETVGMLRGLHYGGAIDSWQLLALTDLAGSAYINAGKPW
ncbi:hypothetical protein RBT98_03115 [Pseudomonas aeruginosa]|uniref:hypothetical protein n=2 Tax=Pseudomonas aeruginosa TaxID=287 RepID=UPI0027D3BF5D|nr:hypothetical protein [Pseudomonas aeruginosa]MDQ4364727.1 hypothetical protein [Pseudomonas aeruginosa]MDQ4391812.1 hypothetical protein [Pseudomonas aeruginosa]HCF4893212.1 hypothetical protein [Pseudomonas aeruginosa]